MKPGPTGEGGVQGAGAIDRGIQGSPDVASASLFGARPPVQAPASMLADMLARARRDYESGQLESVVTTLEPWASRAAAVDAPSTGGKSGDHSSARTAASAWSLLARASSRLGRADFSAQAAKRATAAFDSLLRDGEALTDGESVDRAIALYLADRLPEAAEAMRQKLSESAGIAEMRVYQGLIELRRGNAENAVLALEMARAVEGPDLQRLRLETLAQALAQLGPSRADDTVAAYIALADIDYRASDYGKALESLTAALAVRPDAPNLLAAKAEVLRMQNRFDLAVVAFDAALAIQPEYPWALARKGEALRMLERNEDALATLDRALSFAPTDEFALASKGEILRVLGRNEEALAAFDAALAIQPGYAWALTRKGETLRTLGRHEESLAALDQAVALAPKDGFALAIRGEALRLLNRHEEALAAFDAALAIHPEYAWVLARKGETLRMLDRHDEALVALDQALALAPRDEFALASKGDVLRSLGRLDEALAAFDAALAIQPAYAWALSNKGQALQTLHRYDEALAAFDAFLAIQPENAWALARKGEALRMLDRYDEAAATFDASLALQPKDAWTLARKGETLRLLERYDEAIATLDQALAQEPHDDFALASKGEALRVLDRYEESLAAFDAALAIHPNDAWDLARKGEVLRMLNRNDDAVAAFDAALALEPNNAWVLASKGAALYATGRQPDSETALRKALELDPRNLFARGILGKVLIATGREQDALAEFDLVLQTKPQEIAALEGRSHALMRLDDVETGLATIKRRLEIEPRSGWAHGLLGGMLQMTGEYDDAARELERSNELEPAAWALSALSGCYRQRSVGKTAAEAATLLQQALAASERAVALEPDDLTWRCQLGDSLWLLGAEYRQRARAEFNSTLEAVRSRSKLEYYDAKAAGWAAFRLASADSAGSRALLDEAERFSVEALALQKDRPSSCEAIEVKFNLALAVLCSGRLALALREYHGALALAARKQAGLHRGYVGRAITDLNDALVNWPGLAAEASKALESLRESLRAAYAEAVERSNAKSAAPAT